MFEQWAERLRALASSGLRPDADAFEHERGEHLLHIVEQMSTTNGLARLPRLFAGTVTQTPVIGVRGAIFKAGKLLMIQERRDNKWTLPGGFCDVGDTPTEAVEREVLEESGYEARAVRLIMLESSTGQGIPPLMGKPLYRMMFMCELLGGEARPNHETMGVGFFAEDTLPPLSSPRSTERYIACAFAHYRNSALDVWFD